MVVYLALRTTGVSSLHDKPFVFRKDDRDRQRDAVIWSEYGGKTFLHVRRFFKANDGQWIPTGQGLAIAKENVPAFIEALQKAIEADEQSRSAKST